VSCAGSKTRSKAAVGAGDRCEGTIQESQCSAPTRTGLHDLILRIDGQELCCKLQYSKDVLVVEEGRTTKVPQPGQIGGFMVGVSVGIKNPKDSRIAASD
jgi:hypothetical protein